MIRLDVLLARPQLGFRDALGFPRSTVVWLARCRKMIVTFGRRTADLLAPHSSGLSPFAGMIDCLLKTARLHRHLRQKRIELAETHGRNESGHKSLDEHEPFADGELADVMDEASNCLVVQPLIEGTVSYIDVVA